MSIITERSFEYTKPDWVNDPDISDEDKRVLVEEMGMGESVSGADSMDLQDDCFLCGQKLELPYIYWHGNGDNRASKGISLHPSCARHLCGAIWRDADEIEVS